MKWGSQRQTRVLLSFLAIVVAVGVLVVRLSRISRDGRREVLTWSKSHSLADQPTPSSSPPPQDISGSVRSTPTSPTPNVSPALPIPEGSAPNKLIIPV